MVVPFFPRRIGSPGTDHSGKGWVQRGGAIPWPYSPSRGLSIEKTPPNFTSGSPPAPVKTPCDGLCASPGQGAARSLSGCPPAASLSLGRPRGPPAGSSETPGLLQPPRSSSDLWSFYCGRCGRTDVPSPYLEFQIPNLICRRASYKYK